MKKIPIFIPWGVNLSIFSPLVIKFQFPWELNCVFIPLGIKFHFLFPLVLSLSVKNVKYVKKCQKCVKKCQKYEDIKMNVKKAKHIK